MGLAEMLATQSQWGRSQPAWQSSPSWQPGAVQPYPSTRDTVMGPMRTAPTMRPVDPTLGVPNLAPMPQSFDRTQPVNPLEQQLALRRMMASRGRGVTSGSGWDRNAAPVGVPSRFARSGQPMPGMPTAERAPVTASIYGGR